MSVTWNLWHGCHKLSPGCKHCYMYRADAKYGKNSSIVSKTKDFDLPIRRTRTGNYKIPSGETVYTCFTSDFLLEDADQWRSDAWNYIKIRKDLDFLFITKRIDRFPFCVPSDWQEGYDNVHICCTVETQDCADFRLPFFHSCPIRYKRIVCEPLLEQIDISPYLGPWVLEVIAGGESGNDARVCKYEWILDLRRQCIEHNIPFYFKQTGSCFEKNGKLYRISRKFQHSQAWKANINYLPIHANINLMHPF